MNDVSLEQAIITDRSTGHCSPKSKITRGVVAHAIRYNESYNAMEAVAKLINSTPGSEHAIPTTKYKIKQAVNGLFQPEYYIKCSCNNYSVTTEAKTVCKSCHRLVNRANSPFFVYFPLKVQLAKSINDNFDAIISYNDCMNQSSDTIRDIHDGIEYKKMKKQFPDYFILSLTANTDGAQVFKSSNQSVWPIQLQQNCLPPIVRYIPKNIITAAIHQGKFMPNIINKQIN